MRQPRNTIQRSKLDLSKTAGRDSEAQEWSCLCRDDDDMRTGLRGHLAALMPQEVIMPKGRLSSTTSKVLKASLRQPRLHQLPPGLYDPIIHKHQINLSLHPDGRATLSLATSGYSKLERVLSDSKRHPNH